LILREEPLPSADLAAGLLLQGNRCFILEKLFSLSQLSVEVVELSLVLRDVAVDLLEHGAGLGQSLG
jgi:hypothetical protein